MLDHHIAGRVTLNTVKVVIIIHNCSSEKLTDMHTVYLLMSNKIILWTLICWTVESTHSLSQSHVELQYRMWWSLEWIRGLKDHFQLGWPQKTRLWRSSIWASLWRMGTGTKQILQTGVSNGETLWLQKISCQEDEGHCFQGNGCCK